MTDPAAPFLFRLRVRYSEIDAQGIVYNAHYLTWFDLAVSDYMTEIAGVGFDPGLAQDFHVVRALVEYRAPVRYPADVAITCRCVRIGRSSLTFALAVRGADGTEHTTGEIVWVYADQASHRAVPVPEAIAARLVAHEGNAIRTAPAGHS